jgi:hypothetical protein
VVGRALRDADLGTFRRQRRYLGGRTARPLRRWFHHCTFYGFLLFCLNIGAPSIIVFGWLAPYPAAFPCCSAWRAARDAIGPAGPLVVRERRTQRRAIPIRQPGRVVHRAPLLTSLTGSLLAFVSGR